VQTGDEMVVQVGDYKRNLILPRALATLQVGGARLENGELRITFIRPDSEGGGQPQSKGTAATQPGRATT
jgi:hypothetical protein